MGECANMPMQIYLCRISIAYWYIIFTVPEIQLYVKWYSHKGLTRAFFVAHIIALLGKIRDRTRGTSI